MMNKPIDPDIEKRAYRSLMAAVVIQAGKDAKDGCRKAMAWLTGDGLDWFDALGYNFDGQEVRNIVRKTERRKLSRLWK